MEDDSEELTAAKKLFSGMLFVSGALIFIVGFGDVWFETGGLFTMGWALGAIGLLIILGAISKWPDNPTTKEVPKIP